jgi:Protein of unknown function (DUF2510)
VCPLEIVDRRGESVLSSNSVPPGWYPDPEGKPSEKYWDGSSWTKETRPLSIIPGKPAPQPNKVGLDGNEKALLWIIGIAILIVVLAVPF